MGWDRQVLGRGARSGLEALTVLMECLLLDWFADSSALKPRFDFWVLRGDAAFPGPRYFIPQLRSE